ncbi:unnamed protein product [Durusdinium trenchii]|uniref:snRNA-activating protein complex subunit 3 n=3 Tax=Durusdinium trenchii TaxID=1381693 RepID=A0ABP0H7Y5_9DINO
MSKQGLMKLLQALCILTAQGDPVALEPDFNLVSFTPEDGSTLSGRQALTAVFNLAVIPLGADLGDGPLPEDYVPFILQGAEVPGHLRWVSSSTARFDPFVDWPSDLKDVTLQFNTRLKSVSGKSLKEFPKMRHFSTAPLTFWVREVRSEICENLTDNSWSSSLEARKFKPKHAHECPFDARVLISFNFPVEVKRFVAEPSMFQLREDGMFLSHTTPIEAIAPCDDEVPKPLHLEIEEPAVVNQSRCLELWLPKTLETHGDYSLSLRQGARYHPFAGPFSGNGGGDSDDLKLTGLRPFRFFFLQRHYRRELFKIYLRHGLKAPEESLELLEQAFSISNRIDGEVLQHKLKLINNSTLQLKVVGLQPEEEYTISVSPHGDSVFDGMGLPLQASQGTLKMGEMPGVFLAPQPPNPSLWTSSCSDRFLPQDIPVVFPFLQRQPPRQMYRKVDPGAQMQAFACSISSTDELGDFLTFFFSPGKADTSIPGPCAKRSFQAHPGVILVSGKTEIQFNEVPLNFPDSRLLFLELTCVGNDLGARCATERPASRARFLNAASFSALTAFAAPSSAPYAALGEVRQSTILVSVHSLLDQEPVAGHQVEVWEIPSTRWIHGRSLQPPARRVGTALTDAHGRSLLILPEEQTGQEARDEKGYVAVIANPKTGEILLGDLLRLGPPSPRFVTESEALAASLRLYVTTDRAVYAPGDALALIGVVAAVGSNCPTKKPGSVCSPTAESADSALIISEIIWKLERPGQEEVCSIHLWPLSVMGMFTANITVPQNASLGRLPAVSMYWAGKMIQVPESCSAWRQIRSQMQTPAVSVQGTSFLDILIADPRPPSAVLTLGAPQFLLPSKSLTINATLQTYTGIPLQNHELQVQLVKHGPSKRNENPMPLSTSTSSEADEESTELLGKTDSLGVWSKELRIGGDLPWVPNLGDEITVKVKARGPTGEMLTKSHKLPVRIGPWDITLRTSADMHNADGPLPGQEFAMWTSLEAKYATEGWSVHNAGQLSLVAADDSKATESCDEWLRAKEKAKSRVLDNADGRSCRQEIHTTGRALCHLRLPSTGKFAVVAQVEMRDEMDQDHTVSSCTFLGRAAEDWRRRPLASPNLFKRFEVRPSAAYFMPGDTVKLQVWNPLGVKTRMLLLWGAKPAVTEISNVAQRETVDLGVLRDEDCPMTVCKVHVFLWSIDDTNTLIEDVPLSIHYPKGAPLWAHQEVELQIERPSNILKVKLKPDIKVVKPGEDVEIEVDITQPPNSQAELALLVVDKAWLDLQPLKLREPMEAFEPEKLLSRGPQWRVATSLDGIASAKSLVKATERIRQSFKENPWTGYIGWPLALHPADDSLLDDEHYMNRWAEDLTDFPSPSFGSFPESALLRGGPMLMAKSMAPMALMADAVEESAPVAAGAAMDEGTEAPGSGPAVTLRKRFAKLVALNRALLEVGASTWRTRIRLPEDLSTYVIRVVAVSKEGGNWSWGAAETSVHTAQQVYGKPLLPRMLRFADVCRMGIAIEATSGESPRSLVVEALELQNLRLLDEGQQAVTMLGTSTEVRFTFAADLAVGPASVIFSIKDVDGATLDLVEATVKVEEQQQGLRIASTTSIQADASKAVLRKEAVAALKAVPGSGEMSLSASAGHQAPLLDAIMQLAPTPADHPWQPQGETILAILLGGHVLRAGYGMEAHELDAAISVAQARLAGQVLMDPFLGFVNTPPEHRRWQTGEEKPELLSNALALLVLRAADSLGGVPPAWASLDKDALAGAAYKAIQLRRADWQRCCARDITFASFIGHRELAIFFLALPEAQTRPDLLPLWEEILQTAITGPSGSQLDLLTRLASGQLGHGAVIDFGADRRAAVAADALLERIRVQGPTAYFAESQGSMHAARRSVQSLALWLWTGSKYVNHPFAPLVATHVLSGGLCPWQRHLPAQDIIMASLALVAFDTATGSSQCNIPLQVVAKPSGKKLLQVDLQSGQSGQNPVLSARTAWPWNELPTQLGMSGMDLEIQAGPGRGLAVVSYGMNFIPMVPFLEPQFRGLLVQKIIQRASASHPGRCVGESVKVAFPGETLCVTIQLTSPDDLEEIEVLDFVPAGLEPIDESLENSETSDRIGGDFLFAGGSFLSWEREIRHDSVRWRTGFIWAGTHTLSFNCLANAPGVYSLPAAKAYSAKHPEVMGLSGAASFLVEETGSTSNAVSGPQLREFRAAVWVYLKVEFRESDALATPKACPQACPAAGSCNVAKGRCECASSSGELLPCEEVSVQVKAPFSKLLGGTGSEEFVPPPGGKVLQDTTTTANMPSAGPVVVVLLVALLAAGFYSYFAKMKTPRNFAQPEQELSGDHFTAMPEATLRRRDHSNREEVGLVDAEAAE